MAAAPQSKNAEFNQVIARKLFIENDAGKTQAGSDEGGGRLGIYNKTGESVVQLRAGEYGNGVVGPYNGEGKGRTLQTGPR